MTNDGIAIGDPVEVRKVHITRGEFWQKGAVTYVGRGGDIGVAYADHSREAVERRHWRRQQ